MKALKSVKVKRTQVIQGKKQKISMILNENKKTGKVVADVTSVGRLYHKRLPVTGKARSPTVTSLVAGTTTALDVQNKKFIEIWQRKAG